MVDNGFFVAALENRELSSLVIHTVELTCGLVTKEMFMRLGHHPGTVWTENGKTGVNRSLKERGISKVWVYYQAEGFTGYRICAIVNLKRLMQPKDRLDLYRQSDFPEVEACFNQLVFDLAGLPTLEHWTVHRIDFAVNVHTPYVETYLRLMRKGDIPSHLHIGDFGGGSLYMTSNLMMDDASKHGSRAINFYNKADELRYERDENHNASITDEMIEGAADVLRLEVQCFRPGLHFLKRKYGLDGSPRSFLENADAMAYDVLQGTIKDVCKYGLHRRKRDTLALIDRTFRKGKSEKLKAIINAIASRDDVRRNNPKKGIARAREEMTSTGAMDKDTFARYIGELAGRNINPVCLYDTGEGRELPSVLTIFEQAYQAARDMPG